MELFPTTIAIGKAFCNRVTERKILKNYLVHNRHVTLIAPRRYGKTSLVNQVLLEINLPYCIMELTMATSAKDVERIIATHVGHLLYQILPKTIKARQNMMKLFNWLNPELVLSVAGQKIVLHPEQSKINVVDNIAKLLRKLNDAAKLAKKNIVVVMDEFQQLYDIDDHAIEASIRHAMQYSQNVSYVFLGSNRHMLLSMFNDKNRPFYNSCEIMKLNRISQNDYELFIQKAAKSKWGKKLPTDTLNEIFTLSEFHPSYINRICGHFWIIDKFPTISIINKYWTDFIESKRAEFTQIILKLSKNQKKIIAYLANHPTKMPGSYQICNKLGISEGSLRQATKKLMSQDHIYQDSVGMVRVLDPAFKDFIKYLHQ